VTCYSFFGLKILSPVFPVTQSVSANK